MILRYSNSFLKMLYDNIPEEHDFEIRNYLLSKIDPDLYPEFETEDNPSIGQKFWGDEKIQSLIV